LGILSIDIMLIVKTCAFIFTSTLSRSFSAAAARPRF
jgi:hypothetical protein